jgi:hypothetical protein
MPSATLPQPPQQRQAQPLSPSASESADASSQLPSLAVYDLVTGLRQDAAAIASCLGAGAARCKRVFPRRTAPPTPVASQAGSISAPATIAGPSAAASTETAAGHSDTDDSDDDSSESSS